MSEASLEKQIAINNTPAVLEINFDEIKRLVEEKAKQYDIVVTVDTVSQARTLMADLNKMKKVIDQRSKAEIEKASVGINKFKEQCLALKNIFTDKRGAISDQVEKFEIVSRETLHKLLEELRDSLWESKGVTAEFKSAEFDDLVIVSNLTKTENIAGAAKQALELRVVADKEMQNQTARRLLELENLCYKAGLSAPLQREHVKRFLFDSDAVYVEQLNSLIAIELEREKQAQERMRKQMEDQQRREIAEAEQRARADEQRIAREKREAEEAQAAHERAKFDDPAPQPTVEQGAPTSEPAARKMANPLDPNGPRIESGPREAAPQPTGETVSYVVSCEFHIDAPSHFSPSMIEPGLRKKMKDAGFTSLTSVQVSQKP